MQRALAVLRSLGEVLIGLGECLVSLSSAGAHLVYILYPDTDPPDDSEDQEPGKKP